MSDHVIRSTATQFIYSSIHSSLDLIRVGTAGQGYGGSSGCSGASERSVLIVCFGCDYHITLAMSCFAHIVMLYCSYYSGGGGGGAGGMGGVGVCSSAAVGGAGGAGISIFGLNLAAGNVLVGGVQFSMG